MPTEDKKLTKELWEQVDNEIYHTQANEWWDPSKPFSAGLHAMTPLRAEYFMAKAGEQLGWNKEEKTNQQLTIVDVGCGGGILSEGLVEAAVQNQGFKKVKLVGVDMARGALKVAKDHSSQKEMKFNLLGEDGDGGISEKQTTNVVFEYLLGDACALDSVVPRGSADVVVVADLLEHVLDVGAVVRGVAKILKPGGLFLFDTVNRTFLSYVIAIFLAQELPFNLSLLPSHTHVWGLFLKPSELKELCEQNSMKIGHLCGFRPAFGEDFFRGVFYRSLFHKAKFTLTSDTNVQYIGFATKQK
eukprot:CAMPEP_0201491144 /NCGR_PEP_ID=MMETSP0151_2-20130828/28733_1 /ASSEMBLY_ACC=CAM_ASM_000257 /TAXON_ID=200890 /ORGANISM="Paramoeba atlantica, Strain 621/1 / CCAP 1560/9" /LENGTH=300 /DNA_ID=CAMNT_0047877369 /DNA_START=189 /DNA_END=1091 /DNA_ORIENTATION=+